MKRRAAYTLLAGVLIAALLGAVVPAQAQDAPPAVLKALEALSAQVGTTLTLQNLSSWQWSQQNFPDTSLGCPQEGNTYPQTQTNGFIVTMVYNGVFYDYRVSGNLQTVFRCTPTSGAPGGTPTGDTAQPTLTPQGTVLAPAPTITPIPTAAAPVTGTVVCPGGLPTRLGVGVRAKSIATGSINVRNPADLDDPNAVVGLLLPNAEFNVIGGPQCADNRTWWEITYQSAGGPVTGWVIEGDNVDYWLEPLGAVTNPPAAPTATTGTAAATGTPITTFNATSLVVRTTGDIVTAAQTVFMPAPTPDALIVDAAGGLHYYDGETVIELGGLPDHGMQVRHVATGPISETVARVATVEVDPNAAGGSVLYVYEITKSGPMLIGIEERFGFTLPHVPNSIAFSPDGRLLAASAGLLTDANGGSTPVPPNLVWLWDAGSGQQLPTLQLDGPAADLAFSQDGQYLAITQPTRGVHLWSLGTMAEVALMFNAPGWQGTPSLAYHPSQPLLAVGTVDGKVILYDVSNSAVPEARSVLQVFPPENNVRVGFVAFTRDGSLLVTGGQYFGTRTDSPGIVLWDTATGGRLAAYALPLQSPLTGLALRSEDQALIMVGDTAWWTWGVP